jgi:hypothetical protein
MRESKRKMESYNEESRYFKTSGHIIIKKKQRIIKQKKEISIDKRRSMHKTVVGNNNDEDHLENLDV